MPSSFRFRSTGYNWSSFFPAAVKWLLISNTAIFILVFFAGPSAQFQIHRLFALSPRMVIGQFAVWQLVTYMFLHGGIGHILFNMLALWMFGMDLERDWGTRRFLRFYFLCGIGAGLCDVAVNAMMGNFLTSTIGSSGAIYGLLMAFGVLYPDRVVLMSFLFPIKAKYFVMIIGAIAFLNSFGASSGVSNVAHLGGMAFGYAYLRLRFRRIDTGSIARRYQTWKMGRAKRKFQVYLRKHGSDRDPWVN